ncbi:MAG: hypothetical protein R3F48_13035 [Candidatus Zixiibacteriota bacterium]
MQELIEFCRGPLFRFTFFIMVFGLLRILFLDVWGAFDAYRRAGDKQLAWGAALSQTLQWLFPVKHAFTHRPLYGLFSILFHIGLIIVPIFLLAHIQLWNDSIGLSWWSIPHNWADYLTILTIVCGVLLLIGRISSATSRYLSRKQDFLWPALLILPFISGYMCASMTLSASMYQIMMLVHLLSAELIFVLMPFTKIAHCVVMPISQFIIVLAWKFPAHVNEPIARTLRKEKEAA